MSEEILGQIGVAVGAVMVLFIWFLFILWRIMAGQGKLLRSIKISLNKIEYYLEQSGQKPRYDEPKKKVVRIEGARQVEVRGARGSRELATLREQKIAISKDEPMAKYAGVQVPDDVEISFVDRKEG